MKKFRKKLVSVALSTGIALGGVATCNLCTKTSCSAITPEEIAQLTREFAWQSRYITMAINKSKCELLPGREREQVASKIRQHELYRNFVNGKTRSLLVEEAFEMLRNLDVAYMRALKICIKEERKPSSIYELKCSQIEYKEYYKNSEFYSIVDSSELWDRYIVGLFYAENGSTYNYVHCFNTDQQKINFMLYVIETDPNLN